MRRPTSCNQGAKSLLERRRFLRRRLLVQELVNEFRPMRQRARELGHSGLQGGCQQDLRWSSMDHRGAPCMGNDGGEPYPPFHEKAPLASHRSPTDWRMSICLRLKSHSPYHVVGNSAITPPKLKAGRTQKTMQLHCARLATAPMAPIPKNGNLSEKRAIYGMNSARGALRRALGYLCVLKQRIIGIKMYMLPSLINVMN